MTGRWESEHMPPSQPSPSTADHDSLCEFVTAVGDLGGITCRCRLITKVRVEERERIAQALVERGFADAAREVLGA